MVNHKAQRVGKNGFVFDDDPPASAQHPVDASRHEKEQTAHPTTTVAHQSIQSSSLQATIRANAEKVAQQRRHDRWVKIARWMLIIATVLGVIMTVLLKTVFN